ncbi:hypothetical protein G6F59_018807 [Rhizopus arrhizus]|nr:hypothetical protein G6F59_018807 [Rhizopus arrhizus]
MDHSRRCVLHLHRPDADRHDGLGIEGAHGRAQGLPAAAHHAWRQVVHRFDGRRLAQPGVPGVRAEGGGMVFAV